MEEVESCNETLIEHREAELMVSYSSCGCGDPFIRPAHFLNPAPLPIEPPHIKLCRRGFTIRELRSKFHFRNYFVGGTRWKSWAKKLHNQHEQAWKKAGIYEAIGSSAYQILTDSDVIIAVSEKWCSETNTFVFPWGEATVTLEDVNVLGGFSVLGECVGAPPSDFRMPQQVLTAAFRDICSRTWQVPRTQQWMKLFEGHQFENEAFITLWLSRFVFTSLMDDAINKDVIPIAVRLAEGHPVALAPAVLASICRGLTSMKKRILKMPKDKVLKLYEPFYIVPLWVWERFPQLQPQPNFVDRPDVPRTALWKNVKRLKMKQNIRLILDTSAQCFLWRPYMFSNNGWLVHPLFKNEQQFISLACVSVHVGRDVEAFVRCLRVSHLVGFGGFVQLYLPHRVAMQLGFDQDVPRYIPPCTEAHKFTWRSHSKHLLKTEVYIPPRMSESDVTKRYMDWWLKSVLPHLNKSRGVMKQPRRLRKARKRCYNKEDSEIDSMDLDDVTLRQAMKYWERSKKAKLLGQDSEQIDEGTAMFINKHDLRLDQVLRKIYKLDRGNRGIKRVNVVNNEEAVQNPNFSKGEADYETMRARIIELEATNHQQEARVAELELMLEFLLGKCINREEAA